MARWTETAIKNLKWEGKDYRKTIGDGLVIQVRKSSKTWLLRQQGQGRSRLRTLGKYPDTPLVEARREALKEAEKSTPTAMTVTALAERYMEDVAEEQRAADNIQGYINRAVIPAIGRRRVDSIKKAELVRLLQDYKKKRAAEDNRGGDASRTTDTLRSILNRLFAYAIELGAIERNPMDGVTARVTGYKYTPRDRVLSPDEIRELWGWEHDNARLLRFLLLTGLRIAEARKGYQDGDKWIVPAAASKNKKDHWVYLTETAKDQLPLPSTNDTGVQVWLRRKQGEEFGRDERWTPHDCRRTAATLMNDNGVDPFVVERVLNHTIRGVAGIYNRADYEDPRTDAARVLEQVVLEIVGGKERPDHPDYVIKKHITWPFGVRCEAEFCEIVEKYTGGRKRLLDPFKVIIAGRLEDYSRENKLTTMLDNLPESDRRYFMRVWKDYRFLVEGRGKPSSYSPEAEKQLEEIGLPSLDVQKT